MMGNLQTMAKILFDKRFLWALFITVAVAILLNYVWSSWQAGQGNLLMPLDDVYIHFQYARQMALGHPYHYNLSDPATSGATSFVYPYLLAAGYLLGFQGLWLGLWAMLLGTIALIASMWAVYRLCLALEIPQWLSLVISLAFALTGSIAWHFMSGMETGLMMALSLWTLLFVLEKRLYAFIGAGILLALTRPEGGALAGLASATMFLRLWKDYAPVDKNKGKRWRLLILLLPILAVGIQPLVNLLMTGTSVATGNQAKSILATVPQDWGLILSRILDNFGRMWLELLTGYDGREGRGWYLPALIGFFGLAAIPMLFLRTNYRLVALMLLGWFLAMTMAVSTLDTAFWHFKRYQMPLLALLFPLGAWSILWLCRRFPKVTYGYAVILPIFSAALYLQFLNYYAVNVSYVYQQPYQMALWLRENTPEDARIAVHDVGLMRYLGERETLDIVGLTTPEAAAYWRNGPGSVAEFLMNEQPDYIASYGRGHGYGLAFLADTSLYSNQLASFTVENWQREINVALAADSQGIYQPDWASIVALARGMTSPILYNSYGGDRVLHLGNGFDVANLREESYYDYRWESATPLRGFATEIYQFESGIQTVRRIDGFEEFDFATIFEFDTEGKRSNEPLYSVLATQVLAQYAGSIDIYVDNHYLDTQWIPEMPGTWFTIATYIPPEMQSDNSLIRIMPTFTDGYFMPAYHQMQLALTEEEIEACCTAEPKAFFQDETFALTSVDLEQSDSALEVKFSWYVFHNPSGDYRFFVHLYANKNQEPPAQWDGYFAGMPIGNWQVGELSNIFSRHQISIDISNLPNGTYSLAIGFYNPQNPLDRLMPESDVYEVGDDGRLWLGDVEINR
jgi:hypothetical protein